MAREVSFPRNRHVALSFGELFDDAGPRAAASEAVLLPAPALPLPSQAPADPSVTRAEAPLPRVATVDLATPAAEVERCCAIGGEPVAVRCVNSLEGRASAGEAAARAIEGTDAILVEGLDRWYRMGPDGAGFCRSCELALVEALRESYGDHVQPFDALQALRASAAAPRDRPFARQREAARFAETVEAGKRVVLRARDEARRSRGVEALVLGRVGTLSGAALALCRHLDGLIFDLPSLDPWEAILPLLAARRALGQRPVIAVPPPAATEAQVGLFAALATAADADLLLAKGSSPKAEAALAAHRRFTALVRERYRPSEPLLDADVLVSPLCDHWMAGAHLRASSSAQVALSRLSLQAGVRLELSATPRQQLLVLAGCGALSSREAQAARRHVESGGDLLLIGRCATVDDEGRPGEVVFPEVRTGMERIGEGRAFALEETASEAEVQRAARELLGRGKAHLSLSGRAQLFTRAYLDPERKLDVHLVNFEAGAGSAAQGVQLSITGQAAGGGRAGYWFSPERQGGRDGERIALNPSGFSVSTVLPGIGAYALLAVPR